MTWFFDKAFLEKLDLKAYDPAQIAMRADVPLETARSFVDPKRRYPVLSSPEYGWLAGLDGEQRPTLLFIGAPRLSAADQEAPLNAVTFDLATGEVITRSFGHGEE